MLKELRVRDFAVIDELRLELRPGLNVLTGETGAGKSLVVGALSLLLGERASTEVVRAGADRALVEGVFDVTESPGLVAACEEQGIAADDGWLILRREVLREGRNRAWVNGSPATAGLLGQLGRGLVDLHGQHEHQALLRRDEQRAMLDGYAGASDEAARVRVAYERLADVRHTIEATRAEAMATRERADLLEFRVREIESAVLCEGEDESVAREIRRLEHSEDLLEISSELHSAVYGAEGSLVEVLGDLSRRIRDLVRIDPDAGDLGTLFSEARALLEELGGRLSAYHNAVEHDPERLAALRERSDLIHRLKRKYGATVEEILAVGREAREELQRADRSVLDLESLAAREAEARTRLVERASRLSELRASAARRLEEDVTGLLPRLGMEGGRFRVRLHPQDPIGPSGAESVEFLVTLNPGFEPGPLARIASGGETSRVMLALKTVLADIDRTPSLVFDEIDAGIGGRVALQVGEQLARVAEGRQVLAVTHLPQIASRAGTHLFVEKSERDGRAAASVRLLEGDDRVEELARMLGGDPGREVSLRHAADLLSD